MCLWMFLQPPSLSHSLCCQHGWVELAELHMFQACSEVSLPLCLLPSMRAWLSWKQKEEGPVRTTSVAFYQSQGLPLPLRLPPSPLAPSYRLWAHQTHAELGYLGLSKCHSDASHAVLWSVKCFSGTSWQLCQVCMFIYNWLKCWRPVDMNHYRGGRGILYIHTVCTQLSWKH